MKASQKWAVAAVVMVGPALALLDSTIVTVILSQLQEVFRTDFQTITWTVTAYSLAQAAVIPVVGYISDRTSSKVVFLTSLALFTVGSLLCGLAPTKEALFAFRVLQGLGGGALMPLSLTIIFRIFLPSERGMVIAVTGLPVTLAPAFGPPLGGYLSTTFNWSSVFLINVPIGVVGLLLSFLVVPGRDADGSGDRKGSPQTQGSRKAFDTLGLLLAMVGFTALVYGISLAGSQGWGNPTVLLSLLSGLVVLGVFIVVELRVSDPVLDLRLFLNYTFSISNGVLWIVIGVFSGSLFLLPLFFESVLGETVLTAGTFLTVQGLGVGIGFVIAGFLYNRLGPRILTVIGLLMLIGGTYRLTQIDVHTTGEALQIWLFLRGLGVGVVSQPMQTLALAVVSNRGMAKASSLVNATRQVAIAVAVAVLATYMTGQTATYGVGPQALAAGMADTFWVVLVLGVVCIPLALVMGSDPAIEAQKQAKQAPASTQEVQVTSRPNVISCLSHNGKESLGPELLLWRYPECDVVNGSLLMVGNNHFCVLTSFGTILDVYEAGQHIVQAQDHLHFGSTQITFSGEPIPWQYGVLYINCAKLLIKDSGVALSREMAEVDYSVDYSIHVASREAVIQLLQHMPWQGQTLDIQDIHAYVSPIIRQVVHRILQVTPLEQMNEKMQDLSQLVHQQLQSSLSTYGITLDEVNVLALGPRDERLKALLSLKAFGLSELEAVRYYIAMTNNLTSHTSNEQIEQSLYGAWRWTLEHYADEIVAIQAELASIRGDLSLYLDTRCKPLNARLQELSRAISLDLQASAPDLTWRSLKQAHGPLLSQPCLVSRNGQFKVVLSPPDRDVPTVTEKV